MHVRSNYICPPFAAQFVLAVGLAMGHVRADEPVRFEAVGPDGKPHENVSVTIVKGMPTFVVRHRGGIGRAVVRANGEWPERIVIRFENFPALEGFHTVNGTVRTEARLGFDEKTSKGPFEKYALPKPGEVRSDEPIGRTAITLVRDGKHIVVTVPNDVLPPKNGSLAIDWVDAYRG